MAAQAILEAYAVLTRLPSPHRLTPADALAVLTRNWARSETIALSAAGAWRVVQQHGSHGIAAGARTRLHCRLRAQGES